MRYAWVMLVLMGLLAACGREGGAKVEVANSRPQEYRLKWENYDGTGDKEQAVLLLNGERLGQGAAGREALRKRIDTMPQGSRLIVVPYYGDPGGSVRRSYPIDLTEVKGWTELRGVILMVPSGA